tara:strand:- start:1111 stop:1287 length:177 start_codon:yes stop_codon:yes gene_type:complete
MFVKRRIKSELLVMAYKVITKRKIFITNMFIKRSLIHQVGQKLNKVKRKIEYKLYFFS